MTILFYLMKLKSKEKKYTEEANWSGSALFAIQYLNLYQ